MIAKIVFFQVFLFVIIHGTFVDFHAKPRNVTGTEGEDAYFTCIGKFSEEDNRKESQDLSVTWLRNGVPLLPPYSDRYTIEQSKKNIAILHVKKISRADSSDVFTCVIMDGKNIVKYSLPVYLSVDQVPSAMYPECTTETTELVEGKSALVRCRAEQVNPEPILKWFREGREVKSKQIYDDNFIILEHEFMPQMADNGNVLFCSMTTPAKPNYVSNCSTGALNVAYRPRVNVSGPMSVAAGDEVLFVCFSQAKPEIHHIQWTFDPPLSAYNYVLESKNLVLRIFKASIKENGTKLKCTVTNTVGTNSSEFLLNVKDTERTIDVKPILSTKQAKTGQHEPKPQSMDSAMILSIAGCTLLLATLLITMILCYHHMCRIHRQTLSMAGEQIAQPQVYFEPKDVISPLPQPDYNHYIWRTVGIQVPSDGEIESVYTEIDEGKRRITSLKSISV